MNKKTIIAAASALTVAGLCAAAFENGNNEPTGPEDCDAPDYCTPFEWTAIAVGDGGYIIGQLEKREAPSCEPDTYLVCFDKDNNIIAQDDNSSNKGNGWASGIWGSDCFVDNGDGTRSLRLGVTGRPDGLDGVFNGLFQNGPHGQLGAFDVCVSFQSGGNPLGGVGFNIYSDEFHTGAEAFYINYEVPANATSVHIDIDNQINSAEVRCDVDFFKLEKGLVPLCDYCIEQIGGIDCECRPTNAVLGWFDKSCTLILHSGTGGAVPEYAKLCVVADANGDINIGVTGNTDWNFNGLDDTLEDWWFGNDTFRAPVECPKEKPGHGVAGCYTLKVYVTGAHDNNPPIDAGDSGALMQQALDNGDLNMDGVTNTADLGILLGNFGWAGN